MDHQNNNMKYFSFRTENKKFFMLDYTETIEEEKFLSNGF